MDTVKVTLFKPSGKYYTQEHWTVPEGAIGPYDMRNSPDFRTVESGPVYVPSKRWGYPALLLGKGR